MDVDTGSIRSETKGSCSKVKGWGKDRVESPVTTTEMLQTR